MASETARKNESISVTTRLQQAPQGAKAGDKDGCSYQHSEHGKDEHDHQYSDQYSDQHASNRRHLSFNRIKFNGDSHQ
ncbi:MAG: hypothetical protein RLY72_2335 [Planctomycetota bacterium]